MSKMSLLKVLSFVAALGSTTAYACPDGTTPQGSNLCLLQGDITGKILTLEPPKQYVISGRVFIGRDDAVTSVEAGQGGVSGYNVNRPKRATLVVAPGTVIKGAAGEDALVISRGSQIIAAGTANQPIVFTGARATDGTISRGAWGGLVINGSAPAHNCFDASNNCMQADKGIPGEAETGYFGGDNAADNSGVLKYVRIEYAGYAFDAENELNGIAFQGVGSGTSVDYVQVHMGADDGIEMFGGTVGLRHMLITGALDDSMDWVYGWQGRAQYVIVKQAGDFGERGIEADNNSKNTAGIPRSNPTIANMTIIGSQTTAKPGSAIMLRAGTSASLYNMLVVGSKTCLDIDGSDTFNTGIVMESTMFNCTSPVKVDSDDKFNVFAWWSTQEGNRVSDLGMDGYRPVGDVVSSLDPLFHELYEDEFFEPVEYIGAIDPDGTDWTQGWTVGL